MNPHFFTAFFTLFSFGSGFKVQGSRFRVQGSGFRVQGSRFKVQGSGFMALVAASPPFLLKVQPAPVARARYRLPVEPCPENRSENFFKNPLAKYGGIVYNTFRRTARVLTAK